MLQQNNSIITDEKELTTIFNDHYINIVEKSSGIKPNSIIYEDAKNKEVVREPKAEKIDFVAPKW